MKTQTSEGGSAPRLTMADVRPTFGVSVYGSRNQRRAGSGDTAYSAAGRVSSRGGFCRVMYDYYIKQLLVGSLLTLTGMLAQAQSERPGIFENLPSPVITNVAKVSGTLADLEALGGYL